MTQTKMDGQEGKRNQCEPKWLGKFPGGRNSRCIKNMVIFGEAKNYLIFLSNTSKCSQHARHDKEAEEI